MSDSDIEDIAIISCLAAASAATYNLLLLKRKQNSGKQIEIKKLYNRKRKHSKNDSTQILRNELKLRNRLAYRGILHMNEECYKKMLNYVRPHLTKQTTSMRDPIPVDDVLTAVLIFLATGVTFSDLYNQTGISKSLLSKCIPHCCDVIYNTMRDDYLKFPSSITEWENIATNFSQKWHFPFCLGTLNTQHIAFKRTKDIDRIYYNANKGCNSIVLLGLADADCNFIFIDIGCVGSRSNAGVFNQSEFRNIIDNGENYFPPNSIISNNKSMTYTVIANDEFPLRKHLLTPFPYRSKEKLERIFNVRLNHARYTIDHAFKILINRFGVLKTAIRLEPEKMEKIVQASCVLHNFLNQHNKNYMEPLNTNQLNTFNPIFKENMGINLEPCVTEIRNNYAQYFSDIGKLNWQDKYI